MSVKKMEENMYRREIAEIGHLLNARYFNRSAAIAKINRLIHLFPDDIEILDKYDLINDLPVFYKNNNELKNILLEFRILIEELDA